MTTCDEVYIIMLMPFFFSFSVLQGDDGGEEVQHPGQSQPQQDGLQHSFVKEHFQAQYKYVYICDGWRAYRWVDMILAQVIVKKQQRYWMHCSADLTYEPNIVII